MDLDSKPLLDLDRHIRTDEVGANLERRSLQSGLTTIAAQPIKLAIGVGSTAILARLLTPADFGLVAMAAPLLAFVDSLTNFGLETVTIQRSQLDHQQTSAIFWLSLRINSVVIGGMMAMAPVMAWFYQEPELVGITLAMAIGVFSVCLTSQHQALLRRQLKFEVVTVLEVSALGAGAMIAIAAAWIGWGYWALVLQVVVMQVIQSFASWQVCGWRPVRVIKTPELDANLRSMMSYGGHLTGFRFISRLGNQLDRILIGYFSNASALGLYHVAYRWAYFSFEQIYNPLFNVAVSSLSRAQHDPQLYRRYCRQGLTPIFSVCMPLLTFSFIEAQTLILLLLGNQWLEAVPLFRLLTLAVFVGSMHRVTKWLYVSIGQTQRQFRWGLLHSSVMIVAVSIGAHWGAFGVAMGYTIAICLLTLPSVTFCLKTSPLSLGDFLGVVWRPALGSVLAGLILFSSRFLLPNLDNAIVDAAVKFIIFGVAYLSIWISFPGGRQTAARALQMFKKLRSKQRDS
ncbi:lipopolysaccharide biosynthesis protein [Myxacorys almedinensis]|uniref:Oligosaccharide flippase family protein n=1 Tax=Myxacorys almedinensis A TaxID=2690445 RepID=A0A8J7Z4D9_9CYAN|nr:lipopolysaccharide biosynthesis protein [Myxacorys almedinensis]NDJ17666.1 oligosaccharide flippase family protein [Myxacorys almedinensis A]